MTALKNDIDIRIERSFEFSVVIPFFQRERGILVRAVISALHQEGVTPPRVIVVDDGSPISAKEELRELLSTYNQQLVILEQPNRGPGEARNRGIAEAKLTSSYIAFLDSDDCWSPNHLASAKRALDIGIDFYFCDAIHRDGNATVFQTKSFPPDATMRKHAGDTLEYIGDAFNLFLTGCPIVTSAVAYRCSRIPLLFRSDLRTAGEDYFFWLGVASLQRRIGFSTQQNVQLGRGIGIYANVSWGTPEHLWQIYYNSLYLNDAARLVKNADKYRCALEKRKKRHRNEFLDSMLGGIFRGQTREIMAVSAKYFFRDPAALLSVPGLVAQKALSRVTGKSKESNRGPRAADGPSNGNKSV